MMIELIQEMIIDHQDLTNSKFGSLTFDCDSMVLLDVVVYGNPHTAEIAKGTPQEDERLDCTGHCLIDFASGHA